MSEKDRFTLFCPIRGRLSVTGKSKDGLKPLEEKYRVDALTHLVNLGYPKENFVVEPIITKLGNEGRNSLRADFAVLEVPYEKSMNEKDIQKYALILGEVKRDSKDAKKAERYQVEPLLGFAKNTQCVAVYWDNVNQFCFWREYDSSNKVSILQAPIEMLPNFGQKPGTKALTFADLREEPPMKEMFKEIEDILHVEGFSESKRFQVMLQLLLSKIYDELEAMNGNSLNYVMCMQDYRMLKYSSKAAFNEYSGLVTEAVNYYQNHLPEKLDTLPIINTNILYKLASIISPYKFTSASHSVVQDFYMYFARGIYRWDLAQHFTPPAVTNFIIDIISPTWKQNVLDPACGSADFLASAYRRGVESGYKNYADNIHGFDISKESVQIAVLNMILNGDGKSNISEKNSLDLVDSESDSWDIVVCNPPFGRKILERKSSILRRFNTGHKYQNSSNSFEILDKQESGILFTELCLKITKPGGRIAIVLPNGYLGNISNDYYELRKLILKYAKVAAIIALPRFTFKSSGADVSASILFLEKRKNALQTVPEEEDYHVAVHIIDNVGWSTGDKKASPTYKRNKVDGSIILDSNQEPILESDFDNILEDICSSKAKDSFSWLAEPSSIMLPANTNTKKSYGYSIHINNILKDEYLTLDAKRYSKKIC